MKSKNKDFAPIYDYIDRIRHLGIADEEHIKALDEQASKLINSMTSFDGVEKELYDWDDFSYLPYIRNEFDKKLKSVKERIEHTEIDKLDELKIELITASIILRLKQRAFYKTFSKNSLIKFFKLCIGSPISTLKSLVPIIKQLKFIAKISSDPPAILNFHDNIHESLANALEFKEATQISTAKSPSSLPDEQKEKISALFDYLNKRGYIIDMASHADFVSLFTVNVVRRPIHWSSTEQMLIHLVETLITQKYYCFVAGIGIYEFIEKNFVNKKGRPFVRKQLQIVMSSRQAVKNGNAIDTFFSKQTQIKVNMAAKKY